MTSTRVAANTIAETGRRDFIDPGHGKRDRGHDGPGYGGAGNGSHDNASYDNAGYESLDADLDQPPRRRRWGWLAAAAAVLLLGGFAYVVLDGPTDPPANAAAPLGVAEPSPEDLAAGTTLPGLSFAPVEPTQGTLELTAGATTPAPGLAPVDAPPRQGGVGAVAAATTTSTATTAAKPPPAVATVNPPPATTTTIVTTSTTTTAAAVTYQAASGYGCAGNNDAHNWYPNGQDGSWLSGSGHSGVRRRGAGAAHLRRSRRRFGRLRRLVVETSPRCLAARAHCTSTFPPSLDRRDAPPTTRCWADAPRRRG